ncbi:MAG TPA: molybdopterin-dependent oxidoreductase [Ilumatobacter sp.]|nr:molybdopterin-dependent oxidoreductase [Ilumatobacter sp.]
MLKQRTRGHLARLSFGAAAGLLAAAGGLAAAELAASSSERLQSPVLDVGDQVVDGVPLWLKDLAIEWFGQNDKRALLVGIAIILGLYAAVLGVAALSRRWKLAVAGAGLFGAIGAYTSQASRRPAPWWATFPSIIGGLVTATLLVTLRWALVGRRGASTAPAAGGTDEPDALGLDRQGLDRRRFLAAGTATAVGSAAIGVTARRVSGRFDVDAQRADLTLPPADQPATAAPPGAQAAGADPFFTPNADFYRIDTALTVPQVSVGGWSLGITGRVGRELRLTYDDLLRRELVEADITLACVSNEIGGSLIGTARWLGVRLDDLLDEVGIDTDADQIVGRSVDGFTAGFPTATLDGRDALVAIGMNGEPLPVEHGYPARLIVPGLYGYVSAVKWLSEIELTRFADFDAYWVRRGWADDGPIKLQSRIDTPRGLAKVPAGTVAVAGVAWAQTRGIDAVELQFDDGEWVPAVLADEHTVDTWRQWSYAWDATPGRHTVRVRATERGNGETRAIQTDVRSEPFPSGATGQHQIVVLVE